MPHIRRPPSAATPALSPRPVASSSQSRPASATPGAESDADDVPPNFSFVRPRLAGMAHPTSRAQIAYLAQQHNVGLIVYWGDDDAALPPALMEGTGVRVVRVGCAEDGVPGDMHAILSGVEQTRKTIDGGQAVVYASPHGRGRAGTGLATYLVLGTQDRAVYAAAAVRCSLLSGWAAVGCRTASGARVARGRHPGAARASSALHLERGAGALRAQSEAPRSQGGIAAHQCGMQVYFVVQGHSQCRTPYGVYGLWTTANWCCVPYHIARPSGTVLPIGF